MNKLFLFIIGIFLIGNIMAFDFDNVGSYKEETKTMEIDNAFGIGSTIAKAKLLTPQEVKVIPGENRKIAEIHIESYFEYERWLSKIELYNLKDPQKPMEKNIKTKLKNYVIVEEPIYEIVCEEIVGNDKTKNKTITNSCTNIYVGTQNIEKEICIDYNPTSLPKGNFTIGLFTDVYPDERGEWIPTIMGVRIHQWAIWSSSLNNNLSWYYTFNESTTTFNNSVNGSSYNGTKVNGVSSTTNGIIGNASVFESASSQYAAINFSVPYQMNYTICAWVNSSNSSNGGIIGGSGNQLFLGFGNTGRPFACAAGNICFMNYNVAYDVVSATVPVQNDWFFVCGVHYHNKNNSIFINGTYQASTNCGSDGTGSNDLYIGVDGNGFYLNGTVDEIGYWKRELTAAEITQLYNNGLGLTYISNTTYPFNTNTTNNASTFETQYEGFTLNITNNPSGSLSAEFYYDGIEYTVASAGNSTNSFFSSTLDIPIISASTTKQFDWVVYNGSQYFNVSDTQTVQKTTFSICNSTNPVQYLNISFNNETTTQESVKASIISNFEYYLGAGTSNQTATFSNASENFEYHFCLNAGNLSATFDYEVDFDNSESQQRTVTNIVSWSNSSTDLILFSLPTSLSMFSPFSVVDTNGNSIRWVKGTISRSVGGTFSTITSDTTDSSGFVAYFLNPDFSYSATFSHGDYPSNTFSFVPTTEVRTVVMGSTGMPISNGTDIATGLSYKITPVNSSLSNMTTYTFGFNVSSASLNQITMNITNSSGYQLIYQSNAGEGYISGNTNTGNLTKIIGIYTITRGDEFFSFSRVWNVGTEFEGDYSLHRQLVLYMQYDFNDFFRFLFVIVCIISVLIFMSTNESTDTSESKIIASLLIIWGFSFVGWLDSGVVANSSVEGLNELGRLSNQYGVAILSTGAGIFFIFRRIFS